MTAPNNQRGQFSESPSPPSSPPERRNRGEVLSEFDDGSDHFRVELRCHDLWGTEALVFENDAVLCRRRLYTRELAEQWAETQRAALMRGHVSVPIRPLGC